MNRREYASLESFFSNSAKIGGVICIGLMDKVIPICQKTREVSGVQLHIAEIIAEDNRLAIRYTESGTFTEADFGQESIG